MRFATCTTIFRISAHEVGYSYVVPTNICKQFSHRVIPLCAVLHIVLYNVLEKHKTLVHFQVWGFLVNGVLFSCKHFFVKINIQISRQFALKLTFRKLLWIWNMKIILRNTCIFQRTSNLFNFVSCERKIKSSDCAFPGTDES